MAQDMEEDVDIDDDGIDDLNVDDEIQMPNLFWSMNLTPGSDHELQEPEVPGWIIHVTNACFGVNVKNSSRTVVISQTDNEETPLCVLLEGKNENVTLDLIFSEPIKIKLAGKNPSPVSLTGYLQPPPGFDDDAPSTMGGEDIAEIEDNEEEEQINNLIRKRKLLQAKKDAEEDEEAPKLLDESKDDNVKVPPTKRAKTDNKQQQKGGPKQQQQQKGSPKQPPQQPPQQQLTKQQKKKKQNQNQNKKNEENVVADNKENEEEKEKGATTINITSTTTTTTTTATATATATNEKDVNNKTQQLPKESEKKQDNKNNKNEKKENLKTMKGGVKYKDLKEGKGEIVQQGQKLHIYYVGQLDDKSVFDKVITGKPLEFEYGKGEVVKGLDAGIAGMKIGGKRRIIIPPKLGYGDKATEKIPANSTLTYTIEIRPN